MVLICQALTKQHLLKIFPASNDFVSNGSGGSLAGGGGARDAVYGKNYWLNNRYLGVGAPLGKSWIRHCKGNVFTGVCDSTHGGGRDWAGCVMSRSCPGEGGTFDQVTLPPQPPFSRTPPLGLVQHGEDGGCGRYCLVMLTGSCLVGICFVTV